jgi:hypothetical protein
MTMKNQTPDYYKVERPIKREKWTVVRYGNIDEIIQWDGTVKWRVSIIDEGRDQPFIVRFFALPDIAENFLKRIREQGQE